MKRMSVRIRLKGMSGQFDAVLEVNDNDELVSAIQQSIEKTISVGIDDVWIIRSDAILSIRLRSLKDLISMAGTTRYTQE